MSLHFYTALFLPANHLHLPREDFSPFIESLHIQFVEFWRKKRFYGVDELLFFYRRKKIGEGANEDHVCRLGIPEVARHLLSINDVDILFEVFLEYFLHVVGIFGCSQAHCGRKYLLSVDDDFSFRLHPVDVSQGFEEFEREKEINITVFDERRIYLLAEPEMGRNVTAALGHAMDLCLFHIVTGLQKDLCQNVAGKDRALATHARKEYICYLIVIRHRPPPRHNGFEFADLGADLAAHTLIFIDVDRPFSLMAVFRLARTFPPAYGRTVNFEAHLASPARIGINVVEGILNFSKVSPSRSIIQGASVQRISEGSGRSISSLMISIVSLML